MATLCKGKLTTSVFPHTPLVLVGLKKCYWTSLGGAMSDPTLFNSSFEKMLNQWNFKIFNGKSNWVIYS